MLKKHILLFYVIFIFQHFSFSQNISDYNYIIVPNKYVQFDQENKYNLNKLTKFLFDKKGFKTFYENDQKSEYLTNEPCSILHVSIEKKTNLFTTQIKLNLKDCSNKILFTSKMGKSKLKDIQRSYHEALRNAFKTLKITKKSEKIYANTGKMGTNSNHPSSSNKYKLQKTKTGFLLLNKNMKYEVLKTSQPTLYLLKNKTGYLYKINKKWILEYYENDKLISKIIKLTQY